MSLERTEDDLSGSMLFLVWLKSIESNFVTEEDEHVRSIGTY